MDQKVQVKLIIRRVPMQAALSWLTKAWELFRLAPSTMIAMVAFMTVLSLVAQLHPVLAVLLVLANPFLTAGFYKSIVLLQQQKEVNFQLIFSVFKEERYRRIFIRLAGANLLANIPLMLLMAQLMEQAQAEAVEPLTVLFFVVALSLMFMLFAYAVAIAYFLNEQRLQAILTASLTACWRNVGALTLFGIMAVALGMLGLVTFGFAFVVIIPVLQIAFFLSFSAFFALQLDDSAPAVLEV
ncbi:hypothetical protein Rhein_0422 [Rheinheimera sp. A13L]|uniref:hypothetical protein n=1 Tax=Rheinheimera sp. A13L TaxID=506534 RepID=UPI0002125391|nr:hypothetical protein [Rheinheimera sp. A13L]EGM79538.1 hypothetical protein Rhein_0422 [Rheinheimera sp. A13L]